MRALAIMALLGVALILSGCTMPGRQADVKATTPPSQKIVRASITIPSELDTKITGATATGALWVAPGTPITLTATPPTRAVGTVEYLWAIGQVPLTAPVPKPFAPDTGSKVADYVQPGQSRAIKFDLAGIWQMHCHPHPWARGNVSVIDGYQGPSQVEVRMVDGQNRTDYRFFPENITIGPGTTVVYRNNGSQAHTATSIQQDPPLKKLPLNGTSGTINADGQGWRRIYLYTHDSVGATGTAFYDVYVGTLPTFQPLKVPLEFTVGGAPSEVQGPLLQSLVTNYNGTLWLNYTVSDGLNAATGSTPNTALITVTLKDQGGSGTGQVSANKTTDKLTTRVGSPLGLGQVWNFGVYPEQGAKITGVLTVEVQYDLVPPAPTGYVDPESLPHQH
ncbi:MAG: hypothetical protein WDA16_06055 [Candidatus Thermoplasmatota archaeon]